MKTTHRTCELKILEADIARVWVRGYSEPYTFEAKVYNTNSTDEYDSGRVNDGRIGELGVWIEDRTTGKKDWVVEYRGGLYIGPNKAHQSAVADFIGWLEGMPESSEVKENETFELDI